MPPRRSTAALLGAALALSGGAGCSDTGSDAGHEVPGDVLRVYSSGPLSGRLGEEARAVVRGERLAVEEAGGRVGRWRAQLVVLNDADPKTGRWDPGRVSANARRAAQDDRTIAYLGEMETGASAVAIPIMNETGILEVSPLDSVAGFTRERGGAPGEPDKYYPARDRNFARLVPPDSVQAAALLELLQESRRRRLFIFHDEKQYGQALALEVARGARARGVEVIKSKGLDLDEDDTPAEAGAEARQRAAEVARSEADAFLYAGGPDDVAPLFDALAGANAGLALFAPSAQADDRFAASLSPAAAQRTRVTAPWLEPKDALPAARDFERRYRRRYGTDPPPQSAYGYEAMNVVLAAIEAAGGEGNDRGRVIAEALGLRRSRSVLGTYSIERNGDTTIRVYGAYAVKGGRLSFLRVLDPLGA